MTYLTMRHDFRAPAFGPTSQAEVYAEAMAMYRWADEQGFDFAVISEHHGLEDGWIPSPLVATAGSRRRSWLRARWPVRPPASRLC